MTWSLASYTANGAQGFGVLREDGTLVAPTDLKRWSSTLELLEDWPAAEAVLRELDTRNAPVITCDALLPPLQWPRKVICAASTTASTCGRWAARSRRRAGGRSSSSRPPPPRSSDPGTRS